MNHLRVPRQYINDAFFPFPGHCPSPWALTPSPPDTHSPIPIAKKQVVARAWQVLTPKYGKPDRRQADRVGTHRAVQHFCLRAGSHDSQVCHFCTTVFNEVCQ